LSQAPTQEAEPGEESSPEDKAGSPLAKKKEVIVMVLKTASRTLPDTYFELVKQFPLTHIRNDAHLEEAQEMLDRLLQEELDEGSQEYLDALTDLVETYEDNHHPIPDASEADVLRELMRSNGFSQMKLAKRAGIAQSTISAVLNGNRPLTKKQVVVLARVFGISPSAFLPA
jgi:HTH-type transcriptional regulator/antitoxin HigA